MTDALDKHPWEALRQFTRARIALGRTGDSLPTDPLLAFNLSHAQARDAVHQALDTEAMHAALQAAGFASFDVESAAPDREHYLRRPDLGRRLSDASRDGFAARAATATAATTVSGLNVDIAFVVADGLSSLAVARHAVPVLEAARRRLDGWRIGPIAVARNARVALGDEIGERLQAPLLAMLIGERPGLSSPDSLGIYITYNPRVGAHDAQRNCISNVRPEGLGYEAAAHKLHYLLTHARRLGFTGVALKDNSDGSDGGSTALPADSTPTQLAQPGGAAD